MKYLIYLIASIFLIGCMPLTGEVLNTTAVPTAELVILPTVAPTIAAPTPTAEPTMPAPTAESNALAETAVDTPEPTETAVAPTAEPTPAQIALPGVELFTFQSGEPGWYTVDDDVMGGVSSSTVSLLEIGDSESALYFTGNMSLDNNGGFSSVRSDWTQIDLSGQDGILLKVLGDGKTYRLRIRTALVGSDISYNAYFETTANEWRLAYIPFAQMVPTYRGFVMDVDPVDPSTISSFGFMLSDKQEGEFALQVDWMRAVTEAEIIAAADSD
ncbi:MAG: CIA30 family protein [Chloroflexota bacterium]